MTYSVHQPWDPLKVCVVGKSYPLEFYQFIENPRLRSLFERIASETEEDFQCLISTLKKLNVEVIRPDVPTVQVDQYLTANQRIPGPISMTPRDQMIMIGDRFFIYPYDNIAIKTSGRYINGEDRAEISKKASEFKWWEPIVNRVRSVGNTIIENQQHDILNFIPANGITRAGRDLYFGGGTGTGDAEIKRLSEEFFKDYRCHIVTTGGHIDGCFTPVKPGLIVSIFDIPTYKDTFPGWEVVYLKGESWNKIKPFLYLKQKNQGRWWIKGHEYDDELINYVETWLGEWVGYCEESVFDVNILVVDQQNIIVNGYNEKAFEAFARHGVTAHICPFRHRYFWDGGIHCVTLDLHREGVMQDYFPDRQ